MSERRSGRERRSVVRQRFTPGLVIVFSALVLAATTAIGLGQNAIRHNQDGIQRLQRLQARALYGSCQRVNRLRFNDNRNAATNYQTLNIIIELTKGPSPEQKVKITRVLSKLQGTSPDVAAALAVLIRPVPELHRRFQRLADSIHYIPKTDCRRAVGTPQEFRAPKAKLITSLTRKEFERLRRTGDP